MKRKALFQELAIADSLSNSTWNPSSAADQRRATLLSALATLKDHRSCEFSSSDMPPVLSPQRLRRSCPR